MGLTESHNPLLLVEVRFQLSYAAQFLYPFNHWEFLAWICCKEQGSNTDVLQDNDFYFVLGDNPMYTKGLLNLYGTSIVNFIAPSILACIVIVPIHILKNNVQESHVL